MTGFLLMPIASGGGAHLPRQADVSPDRDHLGRIFNNQARLPTCWCRVW